MSFLDIDIIVLLDIVEKLSGKDTLKLCSCNKKLYKLCEKYQDIIWKKKLLRDYNVEENEIIGSPASYYFGLERNEGWYYYYSLKTSRSVYTYELYQYISELSVYGKGTKEDKPQDYNFFVTGIQEPKEEEILFARFYRRSRKFGRQEVTVTGKNVKKVLDSLIDKIQNEFWHEMPTNLDLYKRILSLSPGEEIDINLGHGADISISFTIQVFLYTIKLPPYSEQ